MIDEAVELCQKCREIQKMRNPASVTCAYLHDNMYCDRVLDIEMLLKKLLNKEEENKNERDSC